MNDEPLFDDEVPDNYDELPEDPTVAELIPHVDSWRRNAYQYTGGNLDAVCAAAGRYLRILAAVPEYERDLAAGLVFTVVPDGWTLTRYLDDGCGYDETPEDDEALLSNLTGDVSYRLRPVRDDEGALAVSVRCPRTNWQSYPTWDAAVADLVVPIADRIAAIPDGGAQQIDGDWYVAVNRRQAWQLVDGLWTLVDIPPEARP